MKLTQYHALRAFAIEALGDRIAGRPDPMADMAQSIGLPYVESLRPAELAAAELLAALGQMLPWERRPGMPEWVASAPP